MSSHLPPPLLSKPTQGSSQTEGQLRVEGKAEGSVVLHETLGADSHEDTAFPENIKGERSCTEPQETAEQFQPPALVCLKAQNTAPSNGGECWTLEIGDRGPSAGLSQCRGHRGPEWKRRCQNQGHTASRRMQTNSAARQPSAWLALTKFLWTLLPSATERL